MLTKKLGVVPGFTIGHVHYWGEPFHNQIVGAARANRIDPSASMKKEGVRFAYHSDSPVSPYGPLKYITQGVTRVWQSPFERVLGPDERISVDDAIRAVTIDAAYQMLSINCRQYKSVCLWFEDAPIVNCLACYQCIHRRHTRP